MRGPGGLGMVLPLLVSVIAMVLGMTGASPWWILPLSGLLVLYYHFILGWDDVVPRGLQSAVSRVAVGIALAIGLVTAIFYFWRLVVWLAGQVAHLL